jgi:hypothetical protein
MKRQNKIIPTVRRKATTLIINFVVAAAAAVSPRYCCRCFCYLFLFLFIHENANCEAKTIIAKT